MWVLSARSLNISFCFPFLNQSFLLRNTRNIIEWHFRIPLPQLLEVSNDLNFEN